MTSVKNINSSPSLSQDAQSSGGDREAKPSPRNIQSSRSAKRPLTQSGIEQNIADAYCRGVMTWTKGRQTESLKIEFPLHQKTCSVTLGEPQMLWFIYATTARLSA
jgi:hypothetical protein